MLLEGKVAMISGVGPGLGRSVATRFAAEGAKLVVGDLNPDAVAATVEAVEATGGEIVGQRTDITDTGDCARLVALALERFGGLDILVNDAYHDGDYRRFEDADLADWKFTAEVNIWGTLQLTQAALAPLKSSGDGRIVMVCTHGVDLIQPTFGAYTGSKASIAHLTKMLAAELGTSGLRVNAVFPGPMWQANLQSYFDQQAQGRGVAPQVVYDEFAALNVLHRTLRPEEVAASVLFLASDLSCAVTGQALYANAGETFH